MNKKIVRDIELALEIQELRKLGLEEEELEGYISFFSKEWEFDNEEQNLN